MAGGSALQNRSTVSANTVDTVISICEDARNKLGQIMDLYEQIHYSSDEFKLILTKLLAILHDRFVDRLGWVGNKELAYNRNRAAYGLFLDSSMKTFSEYNGETAECADFYFREGADYGCSFVGNNLYRLDSWDICCIAVYPDMGDAEDMAKKPSAWVKKYMAEYAKDDPGFLKLRICKQMREIVGASLDGMENYADIDCYRNRDIILIRDFFDSEDRMCDPYVSKAFDLMYLLKHYLIDDMDAYAETSKYAYITLIRSEDGYTGNSYNEECFVPYYWYLAYEFEVIANYLDSVYHFRKECIADGCVDNAA